MQLNAVTEGCARSDLARSSDAVKQLKQFWSSWRARILTAAVAVAVATSITGHKRALAVLWQPVRVHVRQSAALVEAVALCSKLLLCKQRCYAKCMSFLTVQCEYTQLIAS
jgi:hypothetical protein